MGLTFEWLTRLQWRRTLVQDIFIHQGQAADDFVNTII